MPIGAGFKALLAPGEAISGNHSGNQGQPSRRAFEKKKTTAGKRFSLLKHAQQRHPVLLAAPAAAAATPAAALATALATALAAALASSSIASMELVCLRHLGIARNQAQSSSIKCNQTQSSAIKEYPGIARMIGGSIFADELPEPPTGVQTMTEWLRALLRSDDVYEALLGQPNPRSTFEGVGDVE